MSMYRVELGYFYDTREETYLLTSGIVRTEPQAGPLDTSIPSSYSYPQTGDSIGFRLFDIGPKSIDLLPGDRQSVLSTETIPISNLIASESYVQILSRPSTTDQQYKSPFGAEVQLERVDLTQDGLPSTGTAWSTIFNAELPAANLAFRIGGSGSSPATALLLDLENAGFFNINYCLVFNTGQGLFKCCHDPEWIIDTGT